MEISKYIPVTKAKSNLLNIIRQIEASDDTVAVTRKGVPAAVILSVERFEGLLETLEILSDETTMKSLRTSIRQSKNKKWVGYAEVFGR